MTIEKYQSLHELIAPGYNWESCQDGTNVTACGCCEEDNIVEIGKRLKALNERVMVLAYMNTFQSYPWYREGHMLAAHPELWLHNKSGDVVLAGGGHWVFPDHSQEKGAALWEEGALNMTKTGFVDGIFMDGCAKTAPGLGGTTAANYFSGKLAMMQRLQNEVPGPLVCGSNGKVLDGIAASQIQNWGKGQQWSKREIPMLQKAVAQGAMFQAHGACPRNLSDPIVINDLAAFLVAAGPYSYWMCGGWNNAPTEWFPAYDLPLGEPLSNATFSDGVYTRRFSRGTIATFDTTTETGHIIWGSSSDFLV